MKVLVACEFSGIVRDAFAARGHDAMSCDLFESERPGAHYTGDVFDVIDYPWDLGIFHFPCTHTSVSGSRHFEQKRLDGRQQAGVSLFMKGWRRSEHISKVAFEQPISIISTLFRKPDQIIQPYQFGHAESKATCLWLRGLPELLPTQVCEPEYMMTSGAPLFGESPQEYRDTGNKRYSVTHYNPRWSNQTPSGQNKLGPSPDRAKIRSRTYQGIANAMAEQWG